MKAEVALRDDVLLIPEILRSQGWATGAVISHSYIDADRNFDQGFDLFDDGNVKPASGVSSPGVTDTAIAFVHESERPFFLLVHYFDPHFPYREHEGFRMPRPEGAPAYSGPVESGTRWKDLRDLAREGRLSAEDAAEMMRIYDSEIALTDAEIGRLLDALDAAGLADETLVVLTADHGEEFLDHEGLGHTHTLYEELVSVPLIVRYPAATAASREAAQPRVDEEPASLLDVLPTVLDVLGLAPPDDIAGQSLLEPRAPGRPLYSETSRGASLRAVSGGGFKLIEDRQAGTRSLYDLRADASERHDLVDDPEHAAVRDALQDALDRWDAQGEGAIGAPVDVSPEERERLRALGYTED